LKVLLDLRAPPGLSRLVNGKLDTPVAALNYFGHEGGVFRADVLVVEVHKLCETHDVFVKMDPLVHFAFFDMADDVVDRLEADGVESSRAIAIRIERLIPRGKDALIAVAIDKGVRGIAVSLDGGVLVNAGFILEQRGRDDADGPPPDGAVVGGG